MGTIVFAGGGSGGHLSPGLAVNEALPDCHPDLQSLFLCSERAIDREVLSGAAVEFVPIPAAPFSLRPGALLRFLSSMRRSERLCRSILSERRVVGVLALGGFVSVPVVRAARSLGIPVTLLNLDAVAGRANRVVARWADLVLTAIPAEGLARYPNREVEVVGMPIRRAARAIAAPQECRTRLGLDPFRSTLLVTGASQGSQSLNDAIPDIVLRHRDRFDEWQVLHLCGASPPERIDSIRARYEEAGVKSSVVPFLHEMGIAWGAATLAIARGGASTVAEAACNRIPTIVVPFPHHRDQHQRRNAEPLIAHGMARLARDPRSAELDIDDLESVILATLPPSDDLALMALNAKSVPLVDGAAVVARRILVREADPLAKARHA